MKKIKYIKLFTIMPLLSISALPIITACNKNTPVQKCTVTFEASGDGTLSGKTTLEVAAGTSWSQISKPTPVAGSTGLFDSWYKNGKKITSDFTIDADITITAKFGVKRTITLTAGEGGWITSSKTLYVLDGTSWASAKKKASASADVGYEFDNWYNNDHKMLDTDVIKSDMTITAVFNQIIFDVVLNADEGGTLSGSTTIKVKYGTLWKDIANKPEVIPNNNYDFIGWYYNGKLIDENKPIYSNIVVTAKFKEIKLTKSVDPIVYNYNGTSFTKVFNLSDWWEDSVIIRHFDNSPMGYASLEGYLGKRWSTYFDVETKDRKTTITNKIATPIEEGDNKCIVDHNNQTITFQDYEVFSEMNANSYGPMTGGCSGLEKYASSIQVKEYNKNKSLTINLKDYGMRTYCYTIDDVTNGYIPYELIQNVFGLYTGWSSIGYCLDYNGKGFIEMFEGYREDYGYVAYKKASKSFAETGFYNADYMEYCYNLLALTLDLRFGLPERESRSNPGTTIKFLEKGAYETLKPYHDNLVSLDDNMSAAALRKVFFKELDDGGHTGFWDLNALCTKEPTWSTSTFGPEYLHTSMANYYLTEARDAAGISSEGTVVDGYKEYTAEGKETIAYITFDGFQGESSSNYTEAEKTAGRELQEETNESNYMQDTLRLTMYANKQIRANNIKNVVVDLSCNGGGYVYTEFFIASWLCGGVTQKIYNPQTNSYCEFEIKIDVNGDKEFNSLDYLDPNINLFFITSSSSFSCGNALPCNVQDNRPNKTIFMGTKSGGGACYVDGNLMGGTNCQYQISSNMHALRKNSTKDNFITVDTGCTITEGWEMDDISEPERFFERDTINSWIWAL